MHTKAGGLGPAALSEAALFVKRAGRAVAFMGPEYDASITGGAGKIETAIQKPPAHAGSPQLGFNKEKTEPGHTRAFSCVAEDGANPVGIYLSHPATFKGRLFI